MGINALMVILALALIILLVMVIMLTLRVNRLEKKTSNLTAGDMTFFVDQMREMIIESERVAERLDASISERENALEDLSGLVENRIDRLRKITTFESSRTIENIPLGDTPLQSKVYQMLLHGESVESIAKKLGITVAEVDMIINMVND